MSRGGQAGGESIHEHPTIPTLPPPIKNSVQVEICAAFKVSVGSMTQKRLGAISLKPSDMLMNEEHNINLLPMAKFLAYKDGSGSQDSLDVYTRDLPISEPHSTVTFIASLSAQLTSAGSGP